MRWTERWTGLKNLPTAVNFSPTKPEFKSNQSSKKTGQAENLNNSLSMLPSKVSFFICLLTTTMARNATKKGAKIEQQLKFPFEVYEKLELSKRIACYNHWLHLNTAGTQGWSTVDTPSSIYHWRSSNYLRENIKKSSWPKIGKVRT